MAKTYNYTELTGGTDGCLDALTDAIVEDGDFALGVVSGVQYSHYFDADSTTAASSPDVIEPISGSGRWLIAPAHSDLGFSEFSKTLIDDASASEALTTLGFSAFAKTLIDDASASEALTTLGIEIGIANDNIVQIDSANVADNEYARFTASGLEGRTASEVYTDLMAQVLLENDAIKLDAALSADGKYNGITRTGIAGATLAFGDVCYFAVADNRWELADADSAAKAQGLLGICVLAAASDGDATNMLLIGTVRADNAFPSFTVGAPVFLSTTDGDLTSTAPSGTGNIIRVVGQAWTANELWFCPSPDFFEYKA